MIRDLHRRRGRERRGLALAEGVRLVEEVLAAGVTCRAVVTSPQLEATERGRTLKAALAARGPVTEMADEELAGLASTEHPQGVLAVVVPPAWQLADIRPIGPAAVIILDGVQDPGNVGTIIRTALGLGAAGVVSLPGTVETTNPKTLRAAMGASFRLPVVSASEEILAPWLEAQRFTLAVTAADGVPFEPARVPARVALILGNEGGGVGSSLGRTAGLRLAIPLASSVESLNVAVAAGIFLFGARRDR